MKRFFLIFLGMCFLISLEGQSFYFGPKAGGTMAYQQWEGFSQSTYFSYHAAFYIESYSVENEKNSLFAQIGMHHRGSALRNRRTFTTTGQIYDIPTTSFIFRNISLGLGGKRRQIISDHFSTFYSFGLRGEYTFWTNLSEYEDLNNYLNTLYYPTDEFVEKFLYGVSVGAGFEYSFSKKVACIVELSVHPDISKQYFQPPIPNVIDPYNPSQTRNLPERKIRNVTIELSFGFRFLREVIYLDY